MAKLNRASRQHLIDLMAKREVEEAEGQAHKKATEIATLALDHGPVGLGLLALTAVVSNFLGGDDLDRKVLRDALKQVIAIKAYEAGAYPRG
jgi:hypothetical protein